MLRHETKSFRKGRAQPDSWLDNESKNMSGTIEAIIEKLVRRKRRMISTPAIGLTANWHNGVESGGHVQRKLRLGFNSVPAQQPAN
jgi:hypothetical protein